MTYRMTLFIAALTILMASLIVYVEGHIKFPPETVGKPSAGVQAVLDVPRVGDVGLPAYYNCLRMPDQTWRCRDARTPASARR